MKCIGAVFYFELSRPVPRASAEEFEPPAPHTVTLSNRRQFGIRRLGNIKDYLEEQEATA